MISRAAVQYVFVQRKVHALPAHHEHNTDLGLGDGGGGGIRRDMMMRT